MGVKQKFFIIALLLSTCYASVHRRTHGKSRNFLVLDAVLEDDGCLIEKCRENAAKMDEADPSITEFCKTVPGVKPFPKPVCPPLPPRPQPIDDHDVPLTDRLNSGIAQMWPGLQNSTLGIFILGNTGSGKSTLAQILTGNLSHIYATKTAGGSLVIFDENDRIGAPTTVSRTVIPEFLVSSETKAVLWDCPGFDDNRGPEVDISAMYFLKTALDNAQQAKFLLTVSASAMKPGNDRLNFDMLLKHVTQLIDNLEQVANSIGLVVNKVPPYSDSGECRTNEMIMNEFIEFLETYVETTNEKMNITVNPLERLVLAKKVRLVEIILNGNKRTPKITFVRSPNKCGSLDTIPSFGKCKAAIGQLYQEQMEYSSVSPSLFRVSLKTETLRNLDREIIPQTNARVKQEVQESATDVWQQFYHKVQRLVRKLDAQQIFKIWSDVATDFNKYFNLCISSTSDFSEKLEQVYNVFTTDPNATSIKIIAETEKQLQFFGLVSGDKVNIPDVSWLEPLQSLGNNFTELLEFYMFCQKVDAELRTYSKQFILTTLAENEQKRNFAVDDTLEFLSGNSLAGISTQIEFLWQNKLSSVDKTFLANIVRDKLPNANLECTKSAQFEDKYHLQVSGTNVKFSDFLPNSKIAWPGPCSDPEKLKEVSVLARDSIFLDHDFSGNCSTIQLSLLAPIMEVIGTGRTIFLGCVNYKEEIPDAPDGTGYGDQGSPGRSGRPGINSGSFFGVYSNLVNGGNLNIVADGGNGEMGQNGGDGYHGEPAHVATYDDFPGPYVLDKLGSGIVGGFIDDNGNYDSDSRCVTTGIYNKCWYVKLGGQGNVGGRGGRGGDGGAPGHSGNALVVNLSGKGKVGISNRDGIPGTPGKGGKGGKGSQGGGHYSCRLNIIGYTVPIAYWDMCYSSKNKTFAFDGSRGQTGQIVNQPVPLKNVELWPVVILYKQLFFDPRVRNEFVREMEENEQIQEILKPRTFAEELKSVEQVYFKADSQDKLRFDAFYNQFLNRIVAYSQLRNESLSIEDKIVLNFVYTTALGKIVAMKGSTNTVKVTNTLDYFTILAREADIIKEKGRDVAIVEETANYEQILDGKIGEAKSLINNLALPALEKAGKMEQKAQEEMTKEVNEYLKAAKENLDAQRKLELEFRNSLPLRNLLGGLKVVGALCNVFGPEGQIIGAVVESGAAVADSLLLKPPKDSPEFEIPVGFTTEVGKLSKNLLEEKVEILRKEIAVVLEETSNCGGDLDDLKRKAEKVNTELEKLMIDAKAGNYTKGTVENLRKLDELSESLRSEVSKVAENGGQMLHMSTGSRLAESPHTGSYHAGRHHSRNHHAGINQTGKQTLRAEADDQKDKKKKREEQAKRMEKVLKLVNAGVSFVDKIGDQNSRLEKLGKAVEKAEKQVKLIEARKLAMYENLFPALEQMSTDILRMSQRASDKSLVALTVQGWNLQKTVKTMSRYIEKFTKGMAIQEEFQLAIDQMEQAMDLVVTLYEHVERYKEKKQMAGFIANINLAQDQRSQIRDNAVKKLLVELDFAITANIFVEDYQKAMTAFKQWAFPFAGNYLDKREELVDKLDYLWGKPYAEKAMQYIVATYKNKVNRLSTQLAKYYASTKSGDENLIVAKFVGGTVSSRPFFVWDNTQWNRSLRRLLQGEVVHLKADPEMHLGTKRMLEGKGAVKYKSIEPHFTALDPKLKNELDWMLKHFALEMVHSGVSVYDVAGKKYEITDASQTYRLCFEENVKVSTLRDTLCENVVQNKTGDYLMSPYTWWTFQLIDVDPDHGLSFKDLEAKFAGKVNFELEGSGIYLDVKRAGKKFVERLDLDAFYEPMNIDQDFRGISGNKY